MGILWVYHRIPYFLNHFVFRSWGHTDSRVHCRTALCRHDEKSSIIDWVRDFPGAQILWVGYFITGVGRHKLVKRSIRVVKVVLLYRLWNNHITRVYAFLRCSAVFGNKWSHRLCVDWHRAFLRFIFTKGSLYHWKTNPSARTARLFTRRTRN